MQQKILAIGLLLFNTLAMAGTGYLGITSEPSGVKIYINDSYVGTAPYKDYNIKEGKYTIKATYKDNTGSIYPDQIKKVVINELDPKEMNFSFDVRGKTKGTFGGSYDSQVVKEYLQIGNVLILSKPIGAQVFINGEQLKPTPFSRKGVSIGRYNIEFRFNGQSLKGNFDIIKDQTVKLIADFAKGRIVNAYRQRAQLKKEKERRVELARQARLKIEQQNRLEAQRQAKIETEQKQQAQLEREQQNRLEIRRKAVLEARQIQLKAEQKERDSQGC